MNKLYQVYQVSDSTGETLDRIFLAIKAQFLDFKCKTIHFSFTRTENQIDKIFSKSKSEKNLIILYTIVDKALARYLVEKCNAVVSTVTMAMHVAIGLRKPIVLLNNIFNPNEFHFFAPSKIVGPDKNCDCYYLPKCINGRSCIEEISAEKVLAEIKMILPL